MDNAVENVAFLYLMNQDTKSLSLEQLYQKYADTVKQVEAYAKEKKFGNFGFAFGQE